MNLIKKFWLILLILFILFALLPILFNHHQIISSETIEYIKDLIPYNLISKFESYRLESIKSIPRIIIYKTGLDMVYIKPLFGWGAAVYPIFYFIKMGITQDIRIICS